MQYNKSATLLIMTSETHKLTLTADVPYTSHRSSGSCLISAVNSSLTCAVFGKSFLEIWTGTISMNCVIQESSVASGASETSSPTQHSLFSIVWDTCTNVSQRKVTDSATSIFVLAHQPIMFDWKADISRTCSCSFKCNSEVHEVFSSFIYKRRRHRVCDCIRFFVVDLCCCCIIVKL